MRASSFRPRLDRADQLLLESVQERYPDRPSLEYARGDAAIPFVEICPFSFESSLPIHFGKFSRSAWTFVDSIFNPADHPEDSPPDAHAKSVQVADVCERFLAIDAPTHTYLELRIGTGMPALVPFPTLDPVLLGKTEGATIADTRASLHDLVWQVVERLNLLLPPARSLAVIDSANKPEDADGRFPTTRVIPAVS
jgi:hypothetical protein